MKDYMRDRILEIATYIVDTKATVRQAAKVFGVSKSTVHTVMVIVNGMFATFLGLKGNPKTIHNTRLPRLVACNSPFIGGGIK